MNQKLYDLTNPQKSILLTEQYFHNTNVNNICGTAIIDEKIDFDIMKTAINNVIKNNDSFHIHFMRSNNDIKQYLVDFEETEIEIIDIKEKSEIDNIEHSILQKHFDIFNSKLFEFKIFRFQNNTGGFLLHIHHLISDAWTLGLTCRKIMQEYSNLINDNISENNITYSYLNSVQEEKEYFSSEKFEKDRKYWNELFNTVPTSANLPSDISNSNSDLSCIGERQLFSISKSKLQIINEFCKQHKISKFNFLMAVYSIYISKITRLLDFTLGTPILNRTNFKEKNTTGMFVNVVPFRVTLDKNINFIDFVTSIANNTVTLLRHQKYPYKFILEELRKKDPSIPNLYDIVISYQLTKANNETDYHYSTRWAFNGNASDNLTIQFFDLDENGILNIAYDYKKLKYSKNYIKNLHNRIIEMIDQILENPSISIEKIKFITNAEKDKILNDFNNTKFKYDKNKNVITSFLEQVRKFPDKTAIIFENKKITYKELNEKSDILANYLISSGVKSQNIVGIMMNRSIEMAVSLLATLKAGAAYLPIDPLYPADRIKYMLEDSKARIVLTNVRQKLNLDINKIDINFENEIFNSKPKKMKLSIKPDDLIYLIYTSGSTGKPKGVMLKHKNITNFLLGTKNVIDFNPEKSMVSVTTICFDIFVLEFWGALTSGMTLVLANEVEQNNAEALNKLCLENNVNMIQTTPSRFSGLIEDSEHTAFIKKMTDIMIGGEALPEALVDKLSTITKASIFNMYGPTETAVWSTIKKVTSSQNITIGKPISNTKCYILDKDKNLLPPYIAGELYIGGDGVSNGYLNKEELTNEKFIFSPFDKNYLIYNTNDLAYFTDNGEIVHLGRTDFQVKIRGYRIELGEIENKIISIPEISNAVVIADDTNKYLICYYTSKEDIDSSKITSYLLKNLPNYMVPSYFYKIETFPLTPNGKLDRKKLPKIPIKKNNEEKCKTQTEKLLFKVISKILKTTDIDINAPFITIGLDSLGIIQAQTMLLQYNYVLNTQDFYKFNTIKSLAQNIDNNLYNYKEHDAQIPAKFKHKFDEILSKIQHKTFSDENLGNVFLTGANGFIGIHILHELLETTNVQVYCLVRGNSIAHSIERLTTKYKFYFNKDILNLINNRVFVYNGNISKQNLGLSNQNLNSIKENVTTFIHTAAIVKHYGNFEQFENININGTKNVAELAFEIKKRFIHISSISVSGNYLVKQDNRNIDFTENNLYIGQNYTDNVYVHSKFEAEKIVLNLMEKGLTAQIHRIGILSGRLSDGIFQENIEDNAFYSRIKSMVTLSCVAESMLEQKIEFTPVDVCTKSIVLLAKNNITNNKIFHLFNHNFIKIRDIVAVLKSFGINIEIVSDKEFENRIIDFSKGENSKMLLGIINDLTLSKNYTMSVNYNFSVNIKSEYTQKYLHLLKNDWNETTTSYIKKLISYMKEVNFI